MKLVAAILASLFLAGLLASSALADPAPGCPAPVWQPSGWPGSTFAPPPVWHRPPPPVPDQNPTVLDKIQESRADRFHRILGAQHRASNPD